ncbi:MAG: Nif3-like dinuclear metal center hexameric protein, partial [Bacteroidales bacterium]|nr:Nif3-like dinuclear metal center hexameric protein [Bacteroidales bacterium]
MKIKDITNLLESFAPLSYQENYDNCGLLIGNKNEQITGVLLCTDIIIDVLKEAKEKKCNLVIAHHPLIFKPLKKINLGNEIDDAIVFAIKNDIAIYAAHTNFDKVKNGVSYKMAEKLNLQNIECLAPANTGLHKFICYVPETHANALREAMFEGGGGHIGNYDKCSYNLSGFGTYRAGQDTNPFLGEIGKMHTEPETRIETIIHESRLSNLIQKVIEVHPYEEPAYDIIPLANTDFSAGLGVIGSFKEAISYQNLIETVKNAFECEIIKASKQYPEKFKTIALCGGSGSSLIPVARAKKADVLITADISYHNFFMANKQFALLD